MISGIKTMNLRVSIIVNTIIHFEVRLHSHKKVQKQSFHLFIYFNCLASTEFFQTKKSYY